MKRWWQASLARRVLFALLSAFLLVWCVLVAVDYFQYRLGFRHGRLDSVARNVAESLPADDVNQAIAIVKAAEFQYNHLRQASTTADLGKLLFRLEDKDGRLIHASVGADTTAIATVGPYPERQVVGGLPYWSTVQEAGAWRLQLLEPVIDDSLIVRLIGGDLLSSMLIAFPVILIIMWLAIYQGLRPLRHLVSTIKAREPGNFSPLAISLKYAELQPLLAAFNHLLAISRHGIERERAFVQDAAHELRTPLAVVGAQAHLLVSVDNQAQQIAVRQALDMAVQRASHLVHQLLTLAAVEGSQQGNEQTVDLVEVTRNILVAASPEAVKKGIEIALESPDRLNARLDTLAFHSVLGNLLDNALAYCPPGSQVTVTLGLEQGSICLSVIDNGPGVSAADLPRLTERFFRASDVERNGSGLGLTIVEQAVKRLGGKLAITLGNGGNGLAVWVRIPAI